MFSSSKNTELAHAFPSFHSSTSFYGLNGTEILLHHNQDLLPNHLLQSSTVPDVAVNTPASNKATFSNQEVDKATAHLCLQANTIASKKTEKKDRHSKISTARGLRDRRVRLSIGIARQFFDLQELLGLDKPSKTIDWLLTKSRIAIQELKEKKQTLHAGCKTNSSSPSECEVVSGTSEAAHVFGVCLGADSKRTWPRRASKAKGLKQTSHAALGLARESRARARARARERTKEKMSVKKFNDVKKASPLSPSIMDRTRPWNQIGVCKIHDSNGYNIPCLKIDAQMGTDPTLHYHYQIGNEVGTRDLYEESNPSCGSGFQKNYVISRDLSSLYNVLSPDATENWDISRITT